MLRQVQVQQDDLGPDGRVPVRVRPWHEEVVERLGPVAHDDHGVVDVALAEGPQGQQLVVGVVLDEQDDALVSSYMELTSGGLRAAVRGGRGTRGG